MKEISMEPNGVEELEALRSNDFDKKPQIVSGLDKTKTIPLGEQPRAVRRQELMVLLGNFGLLSSGMGLGLPTVIMKQLKDPTEIVHFDDSQITWLASINTLSCPLGGLLSGFLLDKIGRKFTLYVLNILSLTAWTMMAAARQNDANAVYIQLLISRFIIGVSMGLSSAPVGVYSAEISLPKIRGRLILGSSISIALGILVIYLLGYFIRDDYHLIALICCGYQIVSIVCIMPLPETPNWLISKKRYDEAKVALNYFRGMEKTSELTAEVQTEYNAIEKSIKLGSNEKKVSFFKLLRLPEVYKPFLILITLFFFQQVSGIFVVVVYAAQIANEASSCQSSTTGDSTALDPLLCAIFIGVARVCMTIPLGRILEKWGRRRSGIVSALGMCMCMLILAGYCRFSWLQMIPYLPAISIVTYIVASTIGLYTLPFFMISELFPQKVRGPASGLTVAFGMIYAFVFIKTYPQMKKAFGGNDYCFLFYGIASFIAAVFIYLALPETRGRTLLEIEDQFRHKKNKKPIIIETEMKEIFVRS